MSDNTEEQALLSDIEESDRLRAESDRKGKEILDQVESLKAAVEAVLVPTTSKVYDKLKTLNPGLGIGFLFRPPSSNIADVKKEIIHTFKHDMSSTLHTKKHIHLIEPLEFAATREDLPLICESYPNAKFVVIGSAYAQLNGLHDMAEFLLGDVVCSTGPVSHKDSKFERLDRGLTTVALRSPNRSRKMCIGEHLITKIQDSASFFDHHNVESLQTLRSQMMKSDPRRKSNELPTTLFCEKIHSESLSKESFAAAAVICDQMYDFLEIIQQKDNRIFGVFGIDRYKDHTNDHFYPGSKNELPEYYASAIAWEIVTSDAEIE